MKRIFSTLFLSAIVGFGAYAQRHCDIALVHVFGPSNNAVISNCTDTNIVSGYIFVNKGPDVLLSTDTLKILDVNNELGWVYLVRPTGTIENGIIGEGDDAVPAPAINVQPNDTILVFKWDDHYERFGTLIDPVAEVFVGPDPGPFFANGSYLYPIEFQGFSNENPTVEDTAIANNGVYIPITIACSTTGIAEVKGLDKQSLSIYPNPTNDNISFDYNFVKATNAIARISDITGRTVLVKDFGKNIGDKKMTMDVSSLNKGTYIIELVTDEHRAISKFSVK